MRNDKALQGRHIFPNLLGFRFWMANTIIFGHLEEIKQIRNILPAIFNEHRTHSIGFYPVLMFFTMSGFLITYQLEVEKFKTQTVSIKKFYRNRIFRIWPVFYLSMFVYWIVMPYSFLGEYANTIFFKALPWLNHANYLDLFEIPKWFLFTLSIGLMPHIAMLLSYVNSGVWIYGIHHWTIGTEEIFYLFWPLLWRKFKNFKQFIVKCFLAYYGALIVCLLIDLFCRKFFHTDTSRYVSRVILFSVLFSYAYCFFIGGIAIYLFLYRLDIVQKYVTKRLTIVCMVVMFGLMFSGFEFPFFLSEIFCTCFAIFMLYLIKDGKKYRILEHPFIVYLGKITYSVYLFHFISIILVMYVLERLHIPQKSLLAFNILQYVFTWIVSFGFAALIYEKFEKKILSLR